MPSNCVRLLLVDTIGTAYLQLQAAIPEKPGGMVPAIHMAVADDLSLASTLHALYGYDALLVTWRHEEERQLAHQRTILDLARSTPLIVLLDETVADETWQGLANLPFVRLNKLQQPEFLQTIRHAIGTHQYLDANAKKPLYRERIDERPFRRLLDVNGDGILILDAQGRTLLANRAAEALFSVAEGQLVGTRPDIPLCFDRPVEFELTNALQTHTIEAKLVEFFWDGHAAVLVSLRDISHRKQHGWEISQQSEQLNKIGNLADTLRSVTTVTGVLKAAAETLFYCLGEFVAVFQPAGAEQSAGVEPLIHVLSLPLERQARVPLSSLYKSKAMLEAYASQQTQRSIVATHHTLAIPLSLNNHPFAILQLLRFSGTRFTQIDIQIANVIKDMANGALMRLDGLINIELRVKERTQALSEANRQLIELDVLKSKFIADVTHELRTPVTTLSLYLEMLERGKVENRQNYVSVIAAEASRLKALVENIMSLSQIDLDRSIPEFQAIELNRMLTTIVKEHSLQAELSHLELTFAPDLTLPEIMGEPIQVAQAITNVVSNALKYTPAGHVHIQTSRESTGAIVITVSDSGIGIDAQEQPRLFERFYRGKRQEMLAKSGTGLGLAIVDEIMARHHGRITVSSDVDKGTTVRLIFPVQ